MEADRGGIRETASRSLRGLSAGLEPAANEDGTVLAALDGRIFNREWLLGLLRQGGHELVGDGDAALLPHLYEEYGAELVHALDGAFALAVWDRDSGDLLLARDRFGERTLFYREHAGGFDFGRRPDRLGAEPAPRLDPAVFSEYLSRGEVPADRALVSGVRQVPPGCTLSRPAGGAASTHRYWRLPQPSDPGGESGDELLAELDRLLSSSLRARLEPAPAVLLGSGPGCTLLAALAARECSTPVRLLAAGLDEPAQAAATGLAAEVGAEYRSLDLPDEELAAAALGVLDAAVQPLGDPAAIGLSALARLRSGEAGVALVAAGGAELFGDPATAAAAKRRRRRSAPSQPGSGDGAAPDGALEVRAPFLEFELAEFAVTVPARLRATGSLLRELGPTAAPQLERGTPIPAAEWLRGPLAGALEAELQGGRVAAVGVEADAAVAAFRRHRGGEDLSAELWPILALGRWLGRCEGRDA